jgi:hypothetical protein
MRRIFNETTRRHTTRRIVIEQRHGRGHTAETQEVAITIRTQAWYDADRRVLVVDHEAECTVPYDIPLNDFLRHSGDDRLLETHNTEADAIRRAVERADWWMRTVEDAIPALDTRSDETLIADEVGRGNFVHYRAEW